MSFQAQSIAVQYLQPLCALRTFFLHLLLQTVLLPIHNYLLKVLVDTGGRMWLSVCPLSKDRVTQECFNDMNHRLRRVDSNPDYNNKIYWWAAKSLLLLSLYIS